MDTQRAAQNRIAELLDNYKPSEQTVELVNKTPVVLLVGISGAGKDTVKRHLLESGEYHHIVSHTTRSPRENAGVLEQDGRDYHFVSLSQAQQMLENGEFVEAKEYSGNVYGTSSLEIQHAHEHGRIAVTDVEVQGVAEYKAISSNVIAIFLVPPSYEEWQRRLLARYGKNGVNKKDMRLRMETAVEELEAAFAQPYYHFVVNEHIELTAAIVDKIAHNHDEFNAIDTAVRDIARDLMGELRKRIYDEDSN